MKKLLAFFAMVQLLVCALALAEPSVSLQAVTVAKGKTVKLTPAYEEVESAKKAKLTWSTSDKTIATISAGTVTGKANGSAVITLEAALPDGSILSADCEVTVETAVTSVKSGTKSLKLMNGEKSEPIAISVLPEDATHPEVAFSSSDETVAVVDDSGVVTGLKAGKATITVTTCDPLLKTQKKVTCPVVVSQQVTGITFSEEALSLAKGKTLKLAPVIAPEDATSKKVTWETSDKNIVSVSNGVATGKGVGTATLTCTAADGSGVTASCQVTVFQAVTGVKLDKNRYSVTNGESLTLTAKVSPEDATNKRVVWFSSDEKIAEVDSFGKVTGVSVGSCTITAEAADGSGKKISATLYVEPEIPLDATMFTREGYFGYYNEFAVTFKNVTKTRTVTYIGFRLEYNCFGSSYSSNCYTDSDRLGPGKKKKIGWWKDAYMTYASNFRVYLTSVQYSDGTWDSFSSGNLIGWFN